GGGRGPPAPLKHAFDAQKPIVITVGIQHHDDWRAFDLLNSPLQEREFFLHGEDGLALDLGQDRREFFGAILDIERDDHHAVPHGAQVSDHPLRTEARPEGDPVSFIDATIAKRLAKSFGEVQSLLIGIADVPFITEHLERDVFRMDVCGLFNFCKDVVWHNPLPTFHAFRPDTINRSYRSSICVNPWLNLSCANAPDPASLFLPQVRLYSVFHLNEQMESASNAGVGQIGQQRTQIFERISERHLTQVAVVGDVISAMFALWSPACAAKPLPDPIARAAPGDEKSRNARSSRLHNPAGERSRVAARRFGTFASKLRPPRRARNTHHRLS